MSFSVANVVVPSPVFDAERDCYRIPLVGKYGTGRFALVDKESLPLVSDRRWVMRPTSSTNYVVGRREYIHRVITETTDSKMVVDHINHDGLDNRLQNLRVTTQSVNSANQRPRQGVSKFKGVSLFTARKVSNPWSADFQYEGVRRRLGYYATEEEAAFAYDLAAKMIAGSGAYLNRDHFDFHIDEDTVTELTARVHRVVEVVEP